MGFFGFFSYRYLGCIRVGGDFGLSMGVSRVVKRGCSFVFRGNYVSWLEVFRVWVIVLFIESRRFLGISVFAGWAVGRLSFEGKFFRDM